MSECQSGPSAVELYNHGKELSEKLLIEDSNLMNLQKIVIELEHKLDILKGKTWSHVCDVCVGGKPVYTNDKQRTSAVEDLLEARRSGSQQVPDFMKDLVVLEEELALKRREFDQSAVSLHSLTRAFDLTLTFMGTKKC